jgi:hypothetical protein
MRRLAMLPMAFTLHSPCALEMRPIYNTSPLAAGHGCIWSCYHVLVYDNADEP